MLCPIQNTRPHYSPDALSDALHDAHQRKDTKKKVQQSERENIPPSQHFEKISSKISWEGS